MFDDEHKVIPTEYFGHWSSFGPAYKKFVCI